MSAIVSPPTITRIHFSHGSMYNARPGGGGSWLNVPAGLRPIGPVPVISPMWGRAYHRVRTAIRNGALKKLPPAATKPIASSADELQMEPNPHVVGLGPLAPAAGLGFSRKLHQNSQKWTNV